MDLSKAFDRIKHQLLIDLILDYLAENKNEYVPGVLFFNTLMIYFDNLSILMCAT